MTKGNGKAIDLFHDKCLRKILQIKWHDHVTTKELLERACMTPLSEEVKYRRWNMIAHILRQDGNNEFNIAMSWAPRVEKEKRKAPDNMAMTMNS